MDFTFDADCILIDLHYALSIIINKTIVLDYHFRQWFARAPSLSKVDEGIINLKFICGNIP